MKPLTYAQTVYVTQMMRGIGILIYHNPIGANFDVGTEIDEHRREAIRRAIVARGLADQTVPQVSGNPTFAAHFRKAYGEPLESEDVVR